MRQIVAINQMQSQIITSNSETFRGNFKNEAEFQDVITKRILEARQMSELEGDLPEDKKKEYAAKAKQMRL